MGNWIFKQRQHTILLLGLDGAGKTSLLYRQARDYMTELGIHSGFGVETIKIHDTSLLCYDLGYRLKGRAIIREYMRTSQGVVYVIDSTERKKLGDALDELVKHVLLEDQIENIVAMVLANKQDIPGAMRAQEVEDALKQKYKFSDTSVSKHTVLVRPCSVKTMEGFNEAFAEFAEQLRLRQSGKGKPGLLSSAAKEDDVSVKAASLQAIEISQTGTELDNEKCLVARTGVKGLCRDPFSYLKSIFYSH